MKTQSRMRNLFLFTLLLFTNCFLNVFGQSVTSDINGGNATSDKLPMQGYREYNYSQMIYFKTEMNSAIQNVSSSITKIKFYYSSGTVSEFKDWTIYLGHTANTTFASTTSWIPSNQLTQVYSGNISPLITAAGWFEITLQTPFTYNGTDNLVVAVHESTPGWNTSAFRKHSATLANRSMHYSDDSTNPNVSSLPTATGRLDHVAQAIFVHEPTGACSGTPAHSNITLTPSTICEGESSVISYNQPVFNTGFEYTWQKYDGTAWVDMATTTSTQYTLSNQTATTNYRVVVKCTASQESDVSEDATLVVEAKPVVTTNITEMVVCNGESVGLIANGANSYVWSPATGLNQTTSNNVNATITANTVYRVIGSSANGCKDTAHVSLSLLKSFKQPEIISPLENCTPGNNITLQIGNGNTPPLNNGGEWEYKFSGSDGAILQDWSTESEYAFTSQSDSIYTVYYTFRSSACPSILPDSVKKQVVVGFGTQATVTAYDCINQGGSISLYDYFGQKEAQLVFNNPMAAAAPEVSISGSALYSDNRLVLTPSSTSISGAALVTIPSLNILGSDPVAVEFNLTADQVYQPYNTGGADGFSYSFGNDVSATSANKHNGSGGKIRISFDAADNSSNLRGIYLIYGKTNTTAPTPGDATTLAFSPNIDWKNRQDVPVKITIENGRLTLTVDNIIIFNNISLPPSYLTENISNWKHYFGAQTGGDAMRQAISNVKIATEGMKFGITQTSTAPSTWQSSGNFTNLTPGTYHIWLAKSETGCNKNVKTVVIENTNPLVNLGTDTVICAGTTLTLDAGNPGASYIWSGTTHVGSTLEVTTAGSYYVQVTNPNGCRGMGAINVGIMEAPQATSISTQVLYENTNFTIIGAQNVNSVDWNFGDGHSLTNAPVSVSHIYEDKGNYTVTATLKNRCSSSQLTAPVVISSVLSADEQAAIQGLKVYPNPVGETLYITTDNMENTTAVMYDAQGRMVAEAIIFVSSVSIDVTEYTAGVYFLHVVNNNKTSVLKISVK